MYDLTTVIDLLEELGRGGIVDAVDQPEAPFYEAVALLKQYQEYHRLPRDKVLLLNLRSGTKALRDLKTLLDHGDLFFVSDALGGLADRYEEMYDEQERERRDSLPEPYEPPADDAEPPATGKETP